VTPQAFVTGSDQHEPSRGGPGPPVFRCHSPRATFSTRKGRGADVGWVSYADSFLAAIVAGFTLEPGEPGSLVGRHS
jgi:hypothetical protein